MDSHKNIEKEIKKYIKLYLDERIANFIKNISTLLIVTQCIFKMMTVLKMMNVENFMISL